MIAIPELPPRRAAIIAGALTLAAAVIAAPVVFTGAKTPDPGAVEAAARRAATEAQLVSDAETALRQRLATIRDALDAAAHDGDVCAGSSVEEVAAAFGMAAAPPPDASQEAIANMSRMMMVKALRERVHNATVEIGGRNPDGFWIRGGSGFFVSERDIVTNAHVVRDLLAALDTILVRSEAMEGEWPVEIAAMIGGEPDAYGQADLGKLDFAALVLDGARAPGTLALAAPEVEGSSALAAGYPAYGVQISDRPQFVLHTGAITTFLPSAPGAPNYLGHSAQLEPGNSGGPLVDGCGRAFGVNTVTISEHSNQQGALSALDLKRFLDDNRERIDAGAAFDDSSCD